MPFWKDTAETCLRLLYPPHCLCCRTLLKGETYLCSRCRNLYDEEKEAYRLVSSAEPVPAPLNRLLALTYYIPGRDHTAARLIFLAKDKRQSTVYDFFAREAMPLLSQLPQKPDGIVYAPRSPRKKAETGTDQAKEIARRIASDAGIPFLPVLRHLSSGEQKKLNAEERADNAASSYSLAGNVPPDSHLLLIDDVCTTGATLGVCASLLLQAGASSVTGLVMAKCRESRPHFSHPV